MSKPDAPASCVNPLDVRTQHRHRRHYTHSDTQLERRGCKTVENLLLRSSVSTSGMFLLFWWDFRVMGGGILQREGGYVYELTESITLSNVLPLFLTIYPPLPSSPPHLLPLPTLVRVTVVSPLTSTSTVVVAAVTSVATVPTVGRTSLISKNKARKRD